MAASISKRRTKAGKTRYLVRYRLGGRSYPVRNAGTFPTERLAKVRRYLVGGEIAAGRDPAILLASLAAEPIEAKTFKAWADEYRQSRVDLAAETRMAIETRIRALGTFGDLDRA